MAESTLSIEIEEIRREVARYMGYTREPNDWTAEQCGDINAAVDRGMRQFLNAYDWSFIEPYSTIGVWAAPSGTISSVSGNPSTIVANESIFTPDDAGTGAELVGQTITLTDLSGDSSETLTVASVTNATTIVATTEATGTYDEATDTVSVSIDGNYNLPDTVGGIEGEMTFDTRTGYPPVTQVSTHLIERERMDSRNVETYRPRYFAVRVRDTAGASGQRLELMLWPKPSAAYTLHYKYLYLPGKLTEVLKYPNGGLMHSETILQSCLAIAEQMVVPTDSRHQQLYQQQLAASIAQDARKGPEYLGYNADRSATMKEYRRPRNSENVTVYGTEYP